MQQPRRIAQVAVREERHEIPRRLTAEHLPAQHDQPAVFEHPHLAPVLGLVRRCRDFERMRVGRDGVDFELLKLRTMVVGAENLGAGAAVNRGDSRITRAGRVLRRLSADELPQLWNVVRGDMSVIGPRPTLRYQVDRYDERQRHRLDVKPGITGWAQIHGRATLPWAERIELDLWYVRHRDWKTDLLILLRTPVALVGGTYKGETGGWRDPGPSA